MVFPAIVSHQNVMVPGGHPSTFLCQVHLLWEYRYEHGIIKFANPVDWRSGNWDASDPWLGNVRQEAQCMPMYLDIQGFFPLPRCIYLGKKWRICLTAFEPLRFMYVPS
jgi:hypothetical protein